MSVKHSFGIVRANGTIDSDSDTGSGDFSVQKDGNGNYVLHFSSPGRGLPSIAVVPISPYFTAQVTTNDYWSNGSEARVRVITGFSDQKEAMDSEFSFVAMWRA